MKKGIQISKRDNVVVVLENISTGEQVEYAADEGIKILAAKNDIDIYHKIAVCDIRKGSAVIKYGEIIGVATKNIKKGEHVHIHNFESNFKN